MLYEVTVRQGYFNQSCINRFHYNSAGTPAAVSGSFALMFALGFIPSVDDLVYPTDSLFWQWHILVASPLTFLEAEVAAMYDPVDFYTRPFAPAVTGAVGGEAMSPLVAFGIYGSRVNRDVGRFQKRLAGVPETSVGTGGVVAAGASPQLDLVANYMDDTVSYDDEGNTLTFTPIVLSYEKYTTPSGKPAYRPYSTLAAQLVHSAQGWTATPYSQVRSQTSRQYGRGA